MANRSGWRALVACGGIALGSGDAVGQGGAHNVTLSVTVSSRKPSGEAWDAFGGAPDIALCTNSALGQRCISGSGVTTSAAFSRGRCQDAFSCVFVVTVPVEGPFSVSIYDVDVSEHDTIGGCMISGRGQHPCGAAMVTSF